MGSFTVFWGGQRSSSGGSGGRYSAEGGGRGDGSGGAGGIELVGAKFDNPLFDQGARVISHNPMHVNPMLAQKASAVAAGEDDDAAVVVDIDHLGVDEDAPQEVQFEVGQAKSAAGHAGSAVALAPKQRPQQGTSQAPASAALRRLQAGFGPGSEGEMAGEI